MRRVLTVFEAICVRIAGLVLAAIMLIVVLDVVLRYAFNAPLPWSYGLISIYLTAALFYLALSYTFARGHHVAVDIVYQRFPPRGRSLAAAAGALVALPVFATISCLAWQAAWEKWRAGDVIAGIIPWPTWGASLLVAVGTGVLVLRLSVSLVHHSLVAVGAMAPPAADCAAPHAE